MTDQWTPSGPLTPANDWGSTCGCAPEGGPSSADNVVITGSPGAITSAPNQKPLWSLVLNDGTPAADFRIDRYDDTGALVDSPMTIVRATGVVAFHDPVMLAADPVQPLEAVTKHYVDINAAGVVEAPIDGTFYGRKSAAWSNPTHLDITDWAPTLAAYYLASNPSGYQTAAQVTASLGPYALTSSVPVASSTAPLMDGTAAVGTGATWARADHVHPTDTSRYAASNPSGYQTAAQVTAAVPVASSTTPLPSGVAAVGTATTYARADHVHPDVYSHTNRIVNGDMRVDQRNNGNPGTAINVYTVDRWQYMATQAAKATWIRQPFGATTAFGMAGFPYVLNLISAAAAYTPLAADTFYIQQQIEADFVSDLAWGTTNAQPVTLSFWAMCDIGGTFGGAICNGPTPPTRSYPFTFTLVASVASKIVITIPGDTASGWALNGNGSGLIVRFDLAAGATFRAAPGAWRAGNFIGATGDVNIVSTPSTNFYLSAVKFEIGSVATPFNRETVGKLLADCQRYYQLVSASVRFPAAAASQFGEAALNWQTMRAAPTAAVVTAGTSLNLAATFPAINSITPQGSRFSIQSAAAGDCGAIAFVLAMNAEL